MKDFTVSAMEYAENCGQSLQDVWEACHRALNNPHRVVGRWNSAAEDACILSDVLSGQIEPMACPVGWAEWSDCGCSGFKRTFAGGIVALLNNSDANIPLEDEGFSVALYDGEGEPLLDEDGEEQWEEFATFDGVEEWLGVVVPAHVTSTVYNPRGQS